MALPAGTRLGPYEIVAPLGAGGMGEVYRARDTKLDRKVAVKVLPDVFAGDAERVARFEREARTLALLNHPHIAHIYGLEESNGLRALVMELVEGPTLADRIALGAIPLDDALAIGRQIADALDVAHTQGIVHRDLKPANIKVREDGTVKVLDFGLAKALEPVDALASPTLANSPTITSPAGVTRFGTILGTAAFMSPEQARGLVVDKRTDIWAFGCVFYEMVTGRGAFVGASVADVLGAILHREPDWTALPPATPPGVRRLLRRCLEKDLRRRLRDIGDVIFELEHLDGTPVDGADTSAKKGASTGPGRISIGVGLTVVGIALASIWWGIHRHPTPAVAGPSIDATLERLTQDPGFSGMPTVSHDGRLLAYASDRAGNGDLDIWLQQTSGGTPLRLTDDPADDSTPDFSPDGSQVVFRSERNGGGVYLVSTLGGPARLLAPEGRRPRFSPDGSQIAFWTGQFRGGNLTRSTVSAVALAGSAPMRVLSDFEVVNNPVWAPDGRSLLVFGRPRRSSKDPGDADWWLAPLDGEPPVKTGVLNLPLLQGTDVAPSAWTPRGVLFSVGDDLWRIALSNAGRITGPTERLTLGVGPYTDPAAGPDGDVVFARTVTERTIEQASIVNPSEPPTRLYADASVLTERASVTRDGSRVALERSTGSSREIWLKDVRSGRQEMVLRVPTSVLLSATVSPNGRRIGYTVGSRVGSRDSFDAGAGYSVETSGGVPHKICDACQVHGFLSDDQRVLVTLADGHAIRLVDARTNVAVDLVSAPEGAVDRPHASPDDRWLAFRWTRGAEGKTYVLPLTPGRVGVAKTGARIEETTTTGRPCGWSLDSRVLYLLLDADGFRCLWGQRVDPTTGVLIGTPFVVRHFHRESGLSTTFGNAIAAGGFFYEAAVQTANLWKLTIPSSR
jgi:Tol biopolymer transport system component